MVRNYKADVEMHRRVAKRRQEEQKAKDARLAKRIEQKEKDREERKRKREEKDEQRPRKMNKKEKEVWIQKAGKRIVRDWEYENSDRFWRVIEDVKKAHQKEAAKRELEEEMQKPRKSVSGEEQTIRRGIVQEEHAAFADLTDEWIEDAGQLDGMNGEAPYWNRQQQKYFLPDGAFCEGGKQKHIEQACEKMDKAFRERQPRRECQLMTELWAGWDPL